MIQKAYRLWHYNAWFLLLPLAVFNITARAQSTATLQGMVVDPSGAAVTNASIIVRHQATHVERIAQTDRSGNYQVAALPVGMYSIEVVVPGFTTQVVNDLILEVSQTVVQDFQIKVSGGAQEVTVAGGAPVIETTTITVGQVINHKTVQEIPLNGRHFVDLGLLIPGSVTPPQNGFLTAPSRGQGTATFNTAGNREDTVNFMINGINLNDMFQNQITFQPSINTVQEIKVDNATFSAEYGRNSGAIVNIATRSGGNEWHGEVFEFIRNDALDAHNFFNPAKTKQPFQRNQFGAAVGGPIRQERTFFFFSYEGLRHRQGLPINSLVLKDEERRGVTDPVVRKLLDFIPRPNAGERQFLGAATAFVDIDQWTGDVSHVLTKNDHLHGYYAIQRDKRGEPTLQGNTIPGFGDTRQSRRQIFTLNETRIFGPSLVNEARFGFNRIYITLTPSAKLNPADFGMNIGIDAPIGLPQIIVANALNFGGPAGFPQGRGDTTLVVSDTIRCLRGRHSLRIGGEFRRFYNNNFSHDTGVFRFDNLDRFIAGAASAFNITLGDPAASISTRAWGLFVQDNIKWQPNLTLELGLRYDWFTTPTERFNRLVIFDPALASLRRVGSGLGPIYHTSNKNFQPRVGFAWDPFKSGKTAVRGAYAILSDQPITNVLAGSASNPPLANPIAFVSADGRTTTFATALADAAASGLNPATIHRDFDNAYVQSWNLNVQRAITSNLGVMIGYFGSKGTHLRIARNINQFRNRVRPFPRLAATSPIRPGALLGNITQVDSGANSSYNALWVTANQRFSRGLQFNASYTWSKSIDYNSLNPQGVAVQNSFNIRGDRGRSDFDARQRFVIYWLYELPWRGNGLVEGWQVSGITQWQSGNPINIIIPTNELTGVANTVRPDVIGHVHIMGKPRPWFTNTVCDPRDPRLCPAGAVFALPVDGASVFHFGNLGRNAINGPRFSNTDFSVLKNTKVSEHRTLQFRVEIFDLFNHANFGQPVRIAQPVRVDRLDQSAFGVIQNTRFPPGDSGSSRQIQFAVKLLF